MPDPRWVDDFNRAAREAPPILLYSSCTIAPGKNAAPNMLGLQSPFRGPLFLDEVRFQLRRETAGSGSLSLPGKVGGAIRAKFTLGRMEVSRGFVPIWLYSTPIQDYYEWALETTGEEPEEVDHSTEFYRWKLPQPLFIDAGQQFMPEFSRPLAAPLDCTESVTIDISYSCRALPVNIRKPEEIHVPYISAFTPDIVTSGADQTQASDELDLVNVFSKPLFAQRMTGRIYDPRGVDTVYLNGVSGEGVALGLEPGVGGKIITVKMADTYGYTMFREFTPFGQAFDTARRAFTFHQCLWQKERYVATVQGIPANVQPQIALIGFRRESPMSL